MTLQFSKLALAVVLGTAASMTVVPASFAKDKSQKMDAANAAALRITVDRARVVRIAKEADTIIVGNPAIVDATIQDARTLVLTGRSFGVTNLIVLDSEGDPVVDETIVVSGHETNTVRIYRQAERETLACSPVCEPTLTIGDDQTTFGVANTQITQRNALSKAAAESK